MSLRMYSENQIQRRLLVREPNRMRTIQLQFGKWRDFLWCKKNKISLYASTRKTFLEKILMIQMLFCPTWFPLIPVVRDLKTLGKEFLEPLLWDADVDLNYPNFSRYNDTSFILFIIF